MAKIVLEPFVYPVDPAVFKVCGVDEAGRGPLMGNVVAACVVLDPNNPIEGLNDSKQLSEKKRDALEPLIKDRALAYGIGQCTPQEIDTLNILNASLEAMRRAYENMALKCDLMLVDGNKVPRNMGIDTQAVVKGDARVAEIAAASILAKVERDRQMYELDKKYPEYLFAKHKGYPTKTHLELLQRLPLLDCYRKSYGPIKKLLMANNDLNDFSLD
ncbi:ribonuclease HII [Succinivibrio dextrinosolvens]|uniref:ribonuclease HII n=1 Tax=Succinivibrio dextrinosolvens TaxID=83771 RepID=UPI00247879CB|nr:ribonuclease HII [Succinivibrio dextrinosolvens]